MATDVLPSRASSDSIVDAWWFRFLVRAALALLAFCALWFADNRFTAFILDGAEDFRYDDSVFLWWAGATVAAGLLFGIATWLPFERIRFLPSRLLLAAVALLPLVHSWWLYNRADVEFRGGLERFYWFNKAGVSSS